MISASWRTLAAIAVMGMAVLPGAQAADPYFKGRTVTLLVGYPPGGGADLSARTFAQYFSKHVPGNPTVIVQSMPGASSAIAKNHVFEVAKGDGETLLYGPWFPAAQLLAMPGIRYRYQDFAMVGMVTVTGYVVYIRTDVAPGGLKSAADLKNAKDVRFAGGSPFSSFDLLGSITLKLFDVPYRHITGYRGSADYRTAVLKGEANASSETTDIYRTVLADTMLKPGIATVLWSIPDRAADGRWMRNATLADVPNVVERYREVFGKEPSGPYAELLQLMSGLRGATHLVIGPPSTKAEVLAELRKGFDGVIADPAYRDEYNRRFGSEPQPVTIADAEGAARALGTVDPQRIALLKAHVEAIGKK